MGVKAEVGRINWGDLGHKDELSANGLICGPRLTPATHTHTHKHTSQMPDGGEIHQQSCQVYRLLLSQPLLEGHAGLCGTLLTPAAQPLDIFSAASPPPALPHPLPAVCLSSLLPACQGNRCALQTRKAVTPSSSEPTKNIHARKDGPDNGVLSNGNQLKLIASSSSVTKLTCYENHQYTFWGCAGTFS